MDEDRRLILNPCNWPLWPGLPLRRTQEPRIGLILDVDGPERYKVYFTYIFAPELKTCETKLYSTVDELLADGWIVD